jgi:eukaryotic-like serine/threonine-protein kinase
VKRTGYSDGVSPAAPAPSPPSGDPTSTVLGDRYALTTRIAVGGMGEVWEATDTLLGRQVAVKILRADLVDSPVFLERFRAEARHTAALAHRGIASIFDYGEDHQDGQCVAYLVMELVAGQPLSKVIADRGALPVDMVLSLLAQTAEALHAAHSMGVIHRDVKPGNVLLLDDGTIKVTDFGISRAANSVALTEVGQVIGTARYIAPEQATGGEATPASDIYSLGVVGYEMLAGHPPFTADNAGALAMAHVHQSPAPLEPTVPADVRALIGEALAKDPADRPGDAHAFAVKLRRLQMVSMPPPRTPDSAADDRDDATQLVGLDDGFEATHIMGADAVGSATAIMPPGGIIGSPDLGMSQQPYESRRQRRRLGIAAAAVLLGVIAITRLQGDGGGGVPGVSTSTTPSTVAFFAIDPNTYIGLPVAAASALISKAGFVVATQFVDAPEAAGIVIGVEPSGQVASGARVTLTVSNGIAASTTTNLATNDGKGNGKGKKKP